MSIPAVLFSSTTLTSYLWQDNWALSTALSSWLGHLEMGHLFFSSPSQSTSQFVVWNSRGSHLKIPKNQVGKSVFWIKGWVRKRFILWRNWNVVGAAMDWPLSRNDVGTFPANTFPLHFFQMKLFAEFDPTLLQCSSLNKTTHIGK